MRGILVAAAVGAAFFAFHFSAVEASPSQRESGRLPASFYSGPAGTNIILPPRATYPARGALLGLTVGGSQFSYAQAIQQMVDRDRQFGRRLDIQHRFLNGTCRFDAQLATTISRHGWIPMFTWSPPGYTDDQIANGLADDCIRTLGRGVAAWGKPMLLRMYHEFDGTWFPYSYDPSNPGVFVEAWRRTVVLLKGQGVRRVSFVWSPHEGMSNPSRPSGYPGDAYVDWVSSDSYNRNNTSSCGLHAGWCDFEEIFHATGSVGGLVVQCPPGLCVEVDYRGVKPFMVSEYGSVEDPASPGRKGTWHRRTLDAVTKRFPGLYALVYFDMDMRRTEAENWRLDTSSSSLSGFKTLAETPYFNSRVPCVRGYSPCLPPGPDLDCDDIADAKKPVRVHPGDPYRLDPGRAGFACRRNSGGGAGSSWGLVLRDRRRQEAASASVGDVLAVVGWSPRALRGTPFELCAPNAHRCVPGSTGGLSDGIQTIGTWKVARGDARRGRLTIVLKVEGKTRVADSVLVR